MRARRAAAACLPLPSADCRHPEARAPGRARVRCAAAAPGQEPLMPMDDGWIGIMELGDRVEWLTILQLGLGVLGFRFWWAAI